MENDSFTLFNKHMKPSTFILKSMINPGPKGRVLNVFETKINELNQKIGFLTEELLKCQQCKSQLILEK